MLELADAQRIDKEKIRQLLSQCRDPKEIITEKFVDLMRLLAENVEEERRMQNLEAYSDGDFRILFHAAVVAATLHCEQKRRSGNSTFEEHLFGAVLNLVKVLGRTRLPVLCAAFLHDAKEDCELNSSEKLTQAWQATFVSQEDPLLRIVASRRILPRVWTLVGAATNVDEPDRAMRQSATIRKLLGAIRDSGYDVLGVKTADRLSNMQTIDSQLEHKRAPISRETYEVYCKLADIIGIQNFVREAVNLCARILNPRLLHEFVELRDRRIFEAILRRVPHADGRESETVTVEEHFRSIFDISGKDEQEIQLLRRVRRVQFIANELSDFSLRKEEPLEQLELSDLPISDLNPLFEIAIIVEPGTPFASIIKHLERQCLKRGGSIKPWPGDPQTIPERGERHIIYSRQLGTVIIRINDSVSEARAKRGALPIASAGPQESGDPMPSHMQSAIMSILRTTKGNVLNTLPLAKELLLRPTVTVFTPVAESKVLPKGATGIDFVAAVHTAKLGAFSRIVSHRTPFEWEDVNPFDELVDGARLQIISQEGKNMSEDPGWLQFCRTADSRYALRRKFSRKSTKEQIAVGKRYLGRTAAVFGLREKDVVRAIVERLQEPQFSPDKILAGIGCASIDILEILAQSLFDGRDVWPLRVLLENQSGMLREFMRGFDEQGINAEDVVQIRQRPPKPHIVRMKVYDEKRRKTPLDMMRMLLKLSYKYDVRVVHGDWMRRTAVRIGDAFKLLWRNLNRPIF